MYIFEYIYLFFGLILFCVITVVILIPSFSISFEFMDIESTSPYECGFQPFESTRQKFDIQFYLVAILFIIFDLEIMFLIPFSIAINFLTNIAVNFLLYFLILLALGIIYEWRYKALDWSESKWIVI